MRFDICPLVRWLLLFAVCRVIGTLPSDYSQIDEEICEMDENDSAGNVPVPIENGPIRIVSEDGGTSIVLEPQTCPDLFLKGNEVRLDTTQIEVVSSSGNTDRLVNSGGLLKNLLQQLVNGGLGLLGKQKPILPPPRTSETLNYQEEVSLSETSFEHMEWNGYVFSHVTSLRAERFFSVLSNFNVSLVLFYNQWDASTERILYRLAHLESLSHLSERLHMFLKGDTQPQLPIKIWRSRSLIGRFQKSEVTLAPGRFHIFSICLNESRQIPQSLGVTTSPTIVGFRKNQAVAHYKSPWSSRSLRIFAEKLLDGVLRVGSELEIFTAMRTAEFGVIGFFPYESTFEFTEFNLASVRHHSTPFIAVMNARVVEDSVYTEIVKELQRQRRDFKPESDFVLAIIRKEGELAGTVGFVLHYTPAPPDLAWDAQEIGTWLQDNAVPFIIELTPSGFNHRMKLCHEKYESSSVTIGVVLMLSNSFSVQPGKEYENGSVSHGVPDPSYPEHKRTLRRVAAASRKRGGGLYYFHGDIVKYAAFAEKFAGKIDADHQKGPLYIAILPALSISITSNSPPQSVTEVIARHATANNSAARGATSSPSTPVDACLAPSNTNPDGKRLVMSSLRTHSHLVHLTYDTLMCILATQSPYSLHRPGFRSIHTSVVPRLGDLIVMFYVHWCGYCRRTMPVFEQLATTLHNHFAGQITVAVFDLDNNEVPAVIDGHVTGSPEIVFFPRDFRSQFHVYPSSDRSLSSLLHFVRTLTATLNTSPLEQDDA